MSPLLHELIVFTGTLGLVFLAYFVLCQGSVPKERSVSGPVREDNPEFPEHGPKTEFAVLLFSAAFGLLWLSTVPLTSGLVGILFGPRYMATLVGIIMLSHQIGAFFGAWLGGLSWDLTQSYDSVWIISVLLGLLAAACSWPIKEEPAAMAAGAA